jgi:hypothetical protein
LVPRLPRRTRQRREPSEHEPALGYHSNCA